MNFRIPLIGLFAAAVLVAAGCSSSEGRAAARWEGTIDTLPGGHVLVHNTATPIWVEESAWQVVEEMRIGSMEGDGPETFGSVNTMEIDAAGRFWILDSQAQELRVFDAGGAHVRTVGRRGGGPGEFAQAVHVQTGPDGNIWVVDPQNNRVSVFDTAGNYLEGKHTAGGFIIIPWPGRFDDAGRYYAPIPQTGGDFRITLVRHDASLQPLDTLKIPTDPRPRESFELRSANGRMVAGVPYQGGLRWKLSPTGTIWAMLTDDYRMFEIDEDGDTLRTITREFTPLPVTVEDREAAQEDMEWFIEQGGQVDWSKLPSTKPATESLFFDDEGRIWVRPVTPRSEEGRRLDVFDPTGRFLGSLTLPFSLTSNPSPIIRDGVLYGVTRDELDVPYVVRARIVRS